MCAQLIADWESKVHDTIKHSHQTMADTQRLLNQDRRRLR
jgi:hypothetical protein